MKKQKLQLGRSTIVVMTPSEASRINGGNKTATNRCGDMSSDCTGTSSCCNP